MVGEVDVFRFLQFLESELDAGFVQSGVLFEHGGVDAARKNRKEVSRQAAKPAKEKQTEQIAPVAACQK